MDSVSAITAVAVSMGIGIAIAAIAAIFIARKLVEPARLESQSASQSEIARLNAVLESAEQRNTQRQEELAASQRQGLQWRSELDSARDERAQFLERANRVPELEHELISVRNQLTAKQDEASKVSAAMAERTGALETAKGRVSDLELTVGERNSKIEQLNGYVAELREKVGMAQTAAESQIAQIESLSSALESKTRKLEDAIAQIAKLQSERAELNTQLQAEREQTAEKLKLLQDAKADLTVQFKALANDILDEKTKKFTEQNQTNLGQILEPLNTRLKEFKEKVEEVYVQESNGRTALFTQVQNLIGLNKQLSEDATNLTRALKGSNKTQGNWGELILENILEASGLRKDEEYQLRETFTGEDGRRAQPDVVIKLPEQRHIVIDAKVSLSAYTDYVNAESDADRSSALGRHLQSVRAHMNSLSDKNYQLIHELTSLDFVILFMPVEPAFMIALANDVNLWNDANRKNVLLVSPSTLLFVLRTVAYLWRTERQNQNVAEIVKRGAELYDKLVGFVTDLEDVGSRLDQAKESYAGAHSKLRTGRGNLIRQAEMLRELGVKPKKSLPTELIEGSMDGELALPEKANAATTSD